MLALVKLALRLSTTTFDDEVGLYIADCISELTHLGITVATDTTTGDPTDKQIQSTIVAYCKWKFGDAENKEAFRSIYNEKVKQLQSMTGYGFPAED